VVLGELWWVDHDIMIQQTGDSASEIEQVIDLKLGILSFSHPLQRTIQGLT
jgi:hypothetical protein